MKQKIIIGVVVILVVGTLFFVVSNQAAPDQAVSEAVPNQVAPDQNISPDRGRSSFDEPFFGITVVDYEKNEVQLSDFSGKPLVINSWAVWCPFCKKELADFAALQEEFPQDITVIAIDRQESLKKARGYTDELDITEKMLFFLDPTDSFYKSIGGFSMPETIFVDETGTIIVHKRGPMDLEEMIEHARKIINTQQPAL